MSNQLGDALPYPLSAQQLINSLLHGQLPVLTVSPSRPRSPVLQELHQQEALLPQVDSLTCPQAQETSLPLPADSQLISPCPYLEVGSLQSRQCRVCRIRRFLLVHADQRGTPRLLEAGLLPGWMRNGKSALFSIGWVVLRCCLLSSLSLFDIS
jgi:hypothetical protein